MNNECVNLNINIRRLAFKLKVVWHDSLRASLFIIGVFVVGFLCSNVTKSPPFLRLVTALLICSKNASHTYNTAAVIAHSLFRIRIRVVSCVAQHSSFLFL
jgi:hypothetical protein